MAYENLIVIDRGPVRTITVNRPDVLNALSQTVLGEFEAVLDDLESSKDIRAVILTGAGEKSFVAGADISEMRKFSPKDAEAASARGQRLFDRLENLPVPVIAAVNGFALGGGLELALACDFIYASENAKLGLVEANLGLIPGYGGVARLCRRVGVALAKELIFSSKICKAEEALRIGLVNKVVDAGEVVEAAMKTATIITEKGPYAVELVKRLLADGQDADLRTANRLEQHSFGLVFSSEDAQEGIAAFLEKRQANFAGH
jgi:enoyl-CoA hydratase